VSDALDDVLEEAQAGKGVALYLLVGEEFLVRKAADDLVKRLLPDASVGLNLAVMDGASPREVAQEMATLSLFPGAKVVLVRDPEFLAPKKGRGDALGKARDAWKAGRRKEGARRLLALAARAGWGAPQLDPAAPDAPSVEQWKSELDVDLAEVDLAFLGEVAAFCREEGITAPEGDATVLVELFERGLPRGHALVLATTELDAKSPLVKLAKSAGRLVERKVASRLKDLDLGGVIKELLEKSGKRLGPGAEAQLKDRVGGNMRLLQSELEKLAAFADGPVIREEDVKLLVGRAREEEFMELSDALQKRDAAAALGYLRDAMGQGAHGLQLLGAVASILRNLLDARERLGRLSAGPFRMSFNEFKSRLFPAMEKELKAAGRKVPHPYAVYAGMQAAARYSRQELMDALCACAEADLQLKSSGKGELVLEALLLKTLLRC
jgi:DNA polymerase-3 subunit delta